MYFLALGTTPEMLSPSICCVNDILSSHMSSYTDALACLFSGGSAVSKYTLLNFDKSPCSLRHRRSASLLDGGNPCERSGYKPSVLTRNNISPSISQHSWLPSFGSPPGFPKFSNSAFSGMDDNSRPYYMDVWRLRLPIRRSLWRRNNNKVTGKNLPKALKFSGRTLWFGQNSTAFL